MAFRNRGMHTPSLGFASLSKRGMSVSKQAILYSVVSIVLLTVSSRLPNALPFDMARSALQTIAFPVRVLGSVITTPFQAASTVAVNLTAQQQTLTDLQQENEQLRARNVELEEAQQTATRLQALLKLQDTYKLKSTAARIISGSTDSWSNTVTIDKGSADGLAVGMPVTDSSSAIGQITSVSQHTSTVRLITDESSGVSAMVQSSRAQGLLVGSTVGTTNLTFIRTTQKVAVGDVVVTSGLGGVYPKGLPLGTVENVESSPGALYYRITVEPYLRAENNEEVLVITSLTEEQKATSEDVAQADAQETSTTNNVSNSQHSSDTSSTASSTNQTTSNTTATASQ